MPRPKQFETVTIQNITGKLFEVRHDNKFYYLEPGHRWSLPTTLGEWFLKKWFRQLRKVGENEMPSVPPTENPDWDKVKPRPTFDSSTAWCQVCGEQFSDDTLLRTHRVKAHGEKLEAVPVPVGNLTCGVCNREFSLKGPFKMHQKKHEREKAREKVEVA